MSAGATCGHDVPLTDLCAACCGRECYCEVCERDAKPADLVLWRGGPSWICRECVEEHERDLAASAEKDRARLAWCQEVWLEDRREGFRRASAAQLSRSAS